MYALWYVFFGTLAITLLGLLLLIIGTRTTEYATYGECRIYISGIVISAVFGFISFALLLCSIFVPFSARKEVLEKKSYYYTTYLTYVEQLKDTGSDTDYGDLASNSRYLEKIEEFNTWVNKSYVDLQVYGRFSQYYFVKDEVEELYVNIGGIV